MPLPVFHAKETPESNPSNCFPGNDSFADDRAVRRGREQTVGEIGIWRCYAQTDSAYSHNQAHL